MYISPLGCFIAGVVAGIAITAVILIVVAGVYNKKRGK
jgi:hypothetical protein